MTLCKDCGEESIEDEFTVCTACCFHDGGIEPRLGFHDDPARDDPTAGVCLECGANVVIENDGDGYIWVEA